MPLSLSSKTALPADGTAGALVARVWAPGEHAGPVVAALRDDGVVVLRMLERNQDTPVHGGRRIRAVAVPVRRASSARFAATARR